MKLESLVGKSFNRFTILSQMPSKAGRMWKCRCLCGKEKILPTKLLTTGIVKSCGCLRNEKTSARSKVEPFLALYNTLAKTTRYPLDLTYEQFLFFTKITECHYCGENIEWTAYNNRGRRLCRYNLDRKDNDLGYSFENCVVCCNRCQYGKNSRFTYEEWLEVGNLIRSWGQK